MDKLKQILRPGGDKDDQIKYGTPEPRDVNSLESPHNREDISAAQKPATDRDTATQIDPADPNAAATSHGVDQTDGIQRQHDTTEQPLGSSSAQSTDHAPMTGVTSTVTPGPASVEQAKRSAEHKTEQQSYDGQSRPVPGTAASHLQQHPDDASTMSIKSGKMGPYALDADEAMAGSEQSKVFGSGAVKGGVPPEKTAHECVIPLPLP